MRLTPTKMNTFIVWSKDNCPYCVKIEAIFKTLDLKYVVYKIGRDFNKVEFYEKFGPGSTFPKVETGTEIIGGCSDTIQWLKDNSYLPGH